MFLSTGLFILCGLAAVNGNKVFGPRFPPIPVTKINRTLDINGSFFKEQIWSTLLRKEQGIRVVGSRDAIFALDMHNLSHIISKVEWPSSKDDLNMCISTGKTQADCGNYIRLLHKVKDGRMYACGTNAFNPVCDYLTLNGTQLQLQGTRENGTGKCPFDPHQRFASIMAYGDLYTATATNFPSTEWSLTRHSPDPISSPQIPTWLSDPQFVALMEVRESGSNVFGDDDKVYLFFNDITMKDNCKEKQVVPFVARVCKGDMGGQVTLQNQWTSFLKADFYCPVPGISLPLNLQDAFVWRGSSWKTDLFFVMFKMSTELTVFCRYSVAIVTQEFNMAKFRKSIKSDDGCLKWDTYEERLPWPRPGGCIDNMARKVGITTSLNLPNKTLQFLKDQPFIHPGNSSLTGYLELLLRGTAFTCFVVDRVTVLNYRHFFVLFIGTEKGSILKAVRFFSASTGFIIEEIQLFRQPGPIKNLHLPAATDILEVHLPNDIIQVPRHECGRYKSCLECVLSQDPYCAWDSTENICTNQFPVEPSNQTRFIQDVTDGDASVCPKLGNVEPKNVTVCPGNIVELTCQRSSNLAQIVWLQDGLPLPASEGVIIQGDSLLVLANSTKDGKLYECRSVEQVIFKTFVTRVVVYRLLVPVLECVDYILLALIVTVAILSMLIIMLLVCVVFRDRIFSRQSIEEHQDIMLR